MSDELINGLVASILNTRELVINIGSEQNVKIGMKFKVLENNYEIPDPITHEILGNIEREKIRVKVVEVKEKLAIARTYETYETSNLVISGSFLDAISGSSTKVKTLRASDSQAPYDPLDEKGSFVKVGDKVIQVKDE